MATQYRGIGICCLDSRVKMARFCKKFGTLNNQKLFELFPSFTSNVIEGKCGICGTKAIKTNWSLCTSCLSDMFGGVSPDNN